MKIFKHIYILVLMMLFSLLIISNNGLSASEISKSDNNNATWKVNEKTTNSLNGVTHSLMYGESTDKSESDVGKQKVNVFEMKADGINSKLVTWAISGRTTYSRAGLSAIAKDYEKEHPGWIVVAGINGDQYYAKYGSGLGADGSFYYYNQPYYPMIIDGERRFPITPTGGTSTNYVGITNDESQESLIDPSTLESIKLEVLNENNEVIYIHDVENVNKKPNQNQTSIWITYNSSENSGETVEHNVKTDNNLYIIEDAEQVYMNNSITYPHGGGSDSLFARGEISLIKDEFLFTSGTFGIETSNKDLTKYLSVDTKIRVQYYYTNEEMNKVESAMGYHSVQRNNNQDVESPQPYDTRRYNRSIFGRKADGTYVLMTVAKGEYSGTTHNESNAILKQFGVTEAYQQDGGGSVTAIIRNKNDEFDIVNTSSDSGSKERSIFNGCFFVVRDTGYRAYQKDSTKNSITLTKINNYNDEYISNVKATVNNQTYEITNENLTIDNLQYDTEYEIKLTYDITVNGKKVSAVQQIMAHTDSFTMPSSGIKVIKTTANSIILERKKVSEDEVVFANVILNDQTYDLKEENKQIEITGLKPSTIYTLEIHYAVKDSIDGKIYEEFEETVQMTKKYNLPEIKKFEIIKQTKNTIEVNIEIIDDFNMAYACYISYNGNQIDCENLKGTYIIEDVNLKKNEYELMLVVQYKEKENFKSLNSDILKTTKITSSCKKNNIIYINLFTTSMLLYIFVKKRK